jgi:hypothetical protein
MIEPGTSSPTELRTFDAVALVNQTLQWEDRHRYTPAINKTSFTVDAHSAQLLFKRLCIWLGHPVDTAFGGIKVRVKNFDCFTYQLY